MAKRERVNPNVELTCNNCDTIFLRTTYEISRRKAKTKKDGSTRVHNFCSRSCSVSWRNKNRELGDEPIGSFKHRPQIGNTTAQKYDPKFAWYLKRMKHYMRFNECWKIDLVKMQSVLNELWTGRCRYTNVPLELKRSNGACDTQNPFFVASIDRIDNSKPYEPANVQWVSAAINMARNKHSATDFELYLKEFFDASSGR